MRGKVEYIILQGQHNLGTLGVASALRDYVPYPEDRQSVRVINLTGTNLTQIPAEVWELFPNLEQLWCADNPNLKTIPAALARLVRLETLKLPSGLERGGTEHSLRATQALLKSLAGHTTTPASAPVTENSKKTGPAQPVAKKAPPVAGVVKKPAAHADATRVTTKPAVAAAVSAASIKRAPAAAEPTPAPRTPVSAAADLPRKGQPAGVAVKALKPTVKRPAPPVVPVREPTRADPPLPVEQGHAPASVSTHAGFLAWVETRVEPYRIEHPDVAFSDVMAHLGQEWNKLSHSERQAFATSGLRDFRLPPASAVLINPFRKPSRRRDELSFSGPMAGSIPKKVAPATGGESEKLASKTGPVTSAPPVAEPKATGEGIATTLPTKVPKTRTSYKELAFQIWSGENAENFQEAYPNRDLHQLLKEQWMKLDPSLKAVFEKKAKERRLELDQKHVEVQKQRFAEEEAEKVNAERAKAAKAEAARVAEMREKNARAAELREKAARAEAARAAELREKAAQATAALERAQMEQKKAAQLQAARAAEQKEAEQKKALAKLEAKKRLRQEKEEEEEAAAASRKLTAVAKIDSMSSPSKIIKPKPAPVAPSPVKKSVVPAETSLAVDWEREIDNLFEEDLNGEEEEEKSKPPVASKTVKRKQEVQADQSEFCTSFAATTGKRCSFRAQIGKRFCKMHDPEHVKTSKSKKSEKAEAPQKIRKAASRPCQGSSSRVCKYPAQEGSNLCVFHRSKLDHEVIVLDSSEHSSDIEEVIIEPKEGAKGAANKKQKIQAIEEEEEEEDADLVDVFSREGSVNDDDDGDDDDNDDGVKSTRSNNNGGQDDDSDDDDFESGDLSDDIDPENYRKLRRAGYSHDEAVLGLVVGEGDLNLAREYLKNLTSRKRK